MWFDEHGVTPQQFGKMTPYNMRTLLANDATLRGKRRVKRSDLPKLRREFLEKRG